MSTEDLSADGIDLGDLDLTPAASEALDINAQSFKQQVLRELSATHRRQGERIRLSDVQVAVEQVAGPSERWARLFPVFVWVIVALTGIALIIPAILIQVGGTSRSWIVGGAGLLVGVSVGTTIALLLQVERLRKRNSSYASQEFLRGISSLERSARQAVTQVLGDDPDSLSLSRVLSALETLDIWTPDDSQIFRRLLLLRNSLVHEESSALPPDSISYGVSQTNRLARLIRHGVETIEADELDKARPLALRLSSIHRRSALAFEERVAYALRQASFDVVTAQRDFGYDLLVETPRGSLAVVVKYREDGNLTAGDILPVLRKRLPAVPVAVVSNASISEAMRKTIASEGPRGQQYITLISWREGAKDAELIEKVSEAAAGGSSATSLGRDAPRGGSVVTAGRAAKRLNTTVGWIVPVLAIAIVGALVWFAYLAQPVQLANVTTQLNPSPYIDSFVVAGTGHVDQGSVPLRVTGMLTEAGTSVAALELDTRPSGESPWQKQPTCCTLLGSAFTGSASLSVASTRAFDFQLVSASDNIVLATGTLAVHLESFLGDSQLAINLIVGLGLAAVVLEILRLVLRPRTAPESASSTRQGEPIPKNNDGAPGSRTRRP